MTWEEFLTTKFELWTDTRSSTDNTLHGSGKTVEKSGILLRCSGSFVIYWSQRDFNHWKVKHFRPRSKWKAMAEQDLCWRILRSKNILMSIKDLDNCEISTRNAITATPPPHLPPPPHSTGDWSGTKDYPAAPLKEHQQNKAEIFLSLFGVV